MVSQPLHMTNGDSTVIRLHDAGIQGDILAWRDALHEGPTPPNLSLEYMSTVRARYLADQGWGDYDDIAADFSHRDAILSRYNSYSNVLLWFEHDLYDQLQLAQILDWFAAEEERVTPLELICINAFPGVEPFTGLGQLTPAQITTLYPLRHQITDDEIEAGQIAWTAFCSADPRSIEAVLQLGATASLPFMETALLRHLEQFPAVRTGLARTERHILEVVHNGAQTPAEIFTAYQAKEEVSFMGDSTLWWYLSRLSKGPAPLVKRVDDQQFFFSIPEQKRSFHTQRLILTATGQKVMAGKADQIKLNGINRWLGGVHLENGAPLWRWDSEKRELVHEAS